MFGRTGNVRDYKKKKKLLRATNDKKLFLFPTPWSEMVDRKREEVDKIICKIVGF